MKSQHRRECAHHARRAWVVLAAALLSPTVLRGGVGTWTSAGPTGGHLRSIVINPKNPSVLYAGSIQTGVFKTTDAGATWTLVNKGLPILPVDALAIDPAGTSVYALISGWGVYRSTDGGASWKGSASGITDLFLISIALDPLSPCTLYVGTNSGGVFKSTDCAKTWAAAGLAGSRVSAIAVDPATPGTVYAGTTNSGIFRSTNGGAAWSAKNAGLVDLNVQTIFADSVLPGAIYAATAYGPVKSTNRGDLWTVMSNGLGSYGVKAFAVQPAFVPVLYAVTLYDGAFLSTDGGGSWSASNTGMGYPPPLFFALAASASAVYGAADDQGVVKSVDSGATWAFANSTMKDVGVTALAINPLDPRTVYAGVYLNGLYGSANGSGTWAKINGFEDLVFNDIAIDPSTPSTLYLANGVSGIAKSIDSGATWNPFNTGLASIGTYLLAIDPASPATLYTAISEGVFKTTTGGSSWSPASSGLPSALSLRALVIDPKFSSTLYAGTWGHGVYKSVDGAMSWVPKNTGLPANALVMSLAIDPQATSTVYVSLDTFPSIWKSTNGGDNWSQTSISLSDFVSALAVDPSDSNVVYAGMTNTGVFKSIDAGATWAPFKQGMGNASIVKIVVDAQDSRHVYASTWNGVFEIRQGPLTFVAIPPCRVIDTRTAPGLLGGPVLNANEVRNFPIAGTCGIPLTAAVVAGNATVTQPSGLGSLTTYLVDTSFPVTSLISFSPNQTRANVAVIQLGPGGDFLVRSSLVSGTVHFILDVNGYFQ